MAAVEADCERLVALGGTRVRRFEPEPPMSAGHIVMTDPKATSSASINRGDWKSSLDTACERPQVAGGPMVGITVGGRRVFAAGSSNGQNLGPGAVVIRSCRGADGASSVPGWVRSSLFPGSTGRTA